MMAVTISMFFTGSLNNTYITAGVGLGMLYVNCMVHYPVSGINNAISVLVATAFGKNDLRECE